MPERKSVQLNVAVTPSMKKRLDKFAERKNMTVAEFVRHCINVCLTAYENKEKSRKQQDFLD